MLSKRVEVIRDQTNEHLDPLKLVLHLRQLVKYNQKMNLSNSLRVADSLLTGSALFLQSISVYWQVYGLHYVLYSFEYHAPITTFILHGFIMFELLSIAWSSTSLNSLVQSLTFEIDRKMTMGGLQLKYRKQLEVLMLELAHSPVEFTALDFVSVNHNLVTDVRNAS
ncbi:hypothetical protein J6590_049333 [Homalodisca vitripennis]|nr:hypothetical protein J6590_049333 [Homalodisca vitripennis]